MPIQSMGPQGNVVANTTAGPSQAESQAAARLAIGPAVRDGVAGRDGVADLARRGGRVAAFSPLYRQVKELITEDLRAGLWKPGDMIPSEVELASRLRVSQGTVRRAIEDLTAENLLVRQQGRGTFVATHLSARSQFRFLRLRRDNGSPLATASEVLDCRRMRAPIDVARRLQLKTGEPVVFVRRLLRVDARPAVLDDLWLPGARFRGLSAERLQAYHGPLYGLFESDFGTRMIRAEDQVRAIEALAEHGRLLGVRTGSALLLVERLSYTYQDVPVEVRKGYYLTRTFHYFNELS